VIPARSIAAAEPFAEESGLDYLTSETHRDRLAARIRDELARRRGFVLVSGDPPPDANLFAPRLQGSETGLRVTVLRCHSGMAFEELTRAFGQALGIALGSESTGRLWPIVSHLMMEARSGTQHILALDAADLLAADVFGQLCRIAKIDEPPLLPVLLFAKDSFAARLEEPPLAILKAAITAHFRWQDLLPDEVGLFIRRQLAEAGEADLFTPDTIDAIAVSSAGDPVLVNRLARGTVEFLRRTGARLALPAAEAGSAEEKLAQATKEKPMPAPAEEKPVAEAPSAGSGGARNPAEAALSPRAAAVVTLDALAREWTKDRDAARAAENMPAPAATADAAAKLAKSGKTSSPRRRRATIRAAVLAYLVVVVASGAAALYLFGPSGWHEAGQGGDAGSASLGYQPQPSAVATVAVAVQNVPQAPPSGASSDATSVAASAAAPAAATASASAVAAPEAMPQAKEPPAAPAVASAAPIAEPADAAPQPDAPAPDQASAPSDDTASPTTASPETVIAAAPPASAEAPPAVAAAAAPTAAAAAPSAAPQDASKAATPPPAAATAPTSGTPVAMLPRVEPPAPQSAGMAPPAPAGTPTAPDNHPSPPPGPQTAPPDLQAPPAPRLPAAEIAILVGRGEQLLAAGDIISARHFFERAAAAGDPKAAFGLGKTYDPLFLREIGVRGVSGNPAEAAKWYRTAALSGDAESSARLRKLMALYPK